MSKIQLSMELQGTQPLVTDITKSTATWKQGLHVYCDAIKLNIQRVCKFRR